MAGWDARVGYGGGIWRINAHLTARILLCVLTRYPLQPNQRTQLSRPWMTAMTTSSCVLDVHCTRRRRIAWLPAAVAPWREPPRTSSVVHRLCYRGWSVHESNGPSSVYATFAIGTVAAGSARIFIQSRRLRDSLFDAGLGTAVERLIPGRLTAGEGALRATWGV